MYQFPIYYPPGFDLAVARELAFLAEQSYAEFERAATWTLPPYPGERPAPYDGYTRFTANCSPHTLVGKVVYMWKTKRLPGERELHGLIAERGDGVYLVFRGTDSTGDWLQDLRMTQTRLRPAMVPKTGLADWSQAALETGVLTIYDTCRECILDKLREYAPPGRAPARRLYITGHSLGAGMAIACLPDVLANTGFTGAHAPVTYTFAGPRVVNREFALAFRGEGLTAFRVVNTDDVVPTMPPAVPLGSTRLTAKLFPKKPLYYHVGTPVHFAVEYPAAPAEQLILEHHRITTYRAALE